MTEIDLLNDLLNSNPNSPALKGEMLLLRLEMKSEFKGLRKELDEKFTKIDESFTRIDERFEKIDQRFENIDGKLIQNDHSHEEMKRLLKAISEQVALLVERSVAT